MTVPKMLRLLAALVLLGASCVPASAQPALTKIVVAPIGSTDMTPFFYALQQGMFKQAGLDVTVQQVPSGATSMTAVVGGAAQIGFSNLLALSIAHQKQIPVRLLAPGVEYNSAAPNVALLVARDGKIASAKQLENATVGVTGLHDLLAVATEAWLAKAGADPAKVKFVELRPSAMGESLRAGRVDAVAIYDPFMGAIAASGGRVLGRPYDAIGARFVNSAWFALAPWVEQHRDAAVRFARVMSQAAQYTNAHYDALIPLIASFSKIPPETLAKMVRVEVPTSMPPSLIQPVIDLSAKYHEIPAPFQAQAMLLGS